MSRAEDRILILLSVRSVIWLTDWWSLSQVCLTISIMLIALCATVHAPCVNRHFNTHKYRPFTHLQLQHTTTPPLLPPINGTLMSIHKQDACIRVRLSAKPKNRSDGMNLAYRLHSQEKLYCSCLCDGVPATALHNINLGRSCSSGSTAMRRGETEKKGQAYGPTES